MSSQTIVVELGSDAATWFAGIAPTDSRPYIPTDSAYVHWSLRDEIHQWLVDRELEYELTFDVMDCGSFPSNYRWRVHLTDSTQALLFKLTFA